MKASPLPTPAGALPDPEAIIDSMGPLLGLDIRPEYRPAITTNLAVTMAHAALVLGFPLDDAAEPAAVFQA